MALNLTNAMYVRNALSPQIMTDADNKNFTAELDMLGTWRDAILIISWNASTSDINDISIHSSDVTGFTESSSNIVTITQDVTNSAAEVTIASNVIASIATTGVYTFHLQNLERYVNCEFDGENVADTGSMVLIGINGQQAPYAAAESAY